MTFLENESSADSLPVGNAPKPLEAAWFPSRLHAFVWRNWSLVTFQKMADVVGATPEDIAELGQSMGLKPSRGLTIDQLRRAHLTIIRRNWHILPYEQLLTLLGWTAEHMAYTLREDDFFYVKLGLLKPKCEPLHWTVPTAEQSKRAKEIAELVVKHFPEGELEGKEPLFTGTKACDARGELV